MRDPGGVPAGSEIRPERFKGTGTAEESTVFDGAGNRIQHTETNPSGVTTKDYARSANDTEVNQYSTITVTTATGATTILWTHDFNGNRLADGKHRYKYDYRNRLVEVRNVATTALIATYGWDAQDCRITKQLPGPLPSDFTRYLYEGTTCIEERDGLNHTVKQYLRGSMFQMQTTGGTYWFATDGEGSISAVIDETGSVVEAYTHSCFGETTVDFGSGTLNEFGWHGLRLDPETDFYVDGATFFDSTDGRNLTRNPPDEWETDELGNGYTCTVDDNNPVSDASSTGGGGPPSQAPTPKPPAANAQTVSTGGTQVFTGPGGRPTEGELTEVIAKTLREREEFLAGLDEVLFWLRRTDPIARAIQDELDRAEEDARKAEIANDKALAELERAERFEATWGKSEADAWADAGERISLKNFAKRQIVDAATGVVGGAALKIGGKLAGRAWQAGRRAYYQARGSGAIGRIGQRAVEKFRGVSQVRLTHGGRTRVVDRMHRGFAHEAKVGRKTLNAEHRQQVAMDAALKKAGTTRGAVWHFYPSPVTGKVGPSGALRAALESRNIGIAIH